MKEHEKNHIRANMLSLMQDTQCDFSLYSDLIARQLLSRNEEDRLTAVKNKDGQMAEAKEFYEIMMTKDNSYNLLIEALKTALKTGAAATLAKICDNSASNSTTSHARESSSASTTDFLAKRIGTEDCDVRIKDIVAIAKNSDNISSVLQDEWTNVARGLDWKGQHADTKKWRNAIQLDKLVVIDVFEEMLMKWASGKGNEAKLGVLIDVVKGCSMKFFADKMEEKFS